NSRRADRPRRLGDSDRDLRLRHPCSARHALRPVDRSNHEGERRGRIVITLDFVFTLMGIMMAGIAVVNLRDRSSPKRYNNAAFWGIYAITFLFGSYLPNLLNGLLVISMVLIMAIGKLGGPPAEGTSRA